MTYQGLKSDLDILQSSYQPYQDDPGGSDSDDDSPPQFHGHGQGGAGEEGVMIHIVPEHGKSRWSHIDDLDSFFSKVYEYHQKHGFKVMMLQEVLELLQFIFVVMFTVFLAECVEYEYLFRDKLVPDHLPGTKLSLHDVTKKVGFYEMHFLTQVFIMISALFWLTRVIVVFHRVFQFWDIKCFYNSALKIPDTSLESVTWWEVQEKLVTAQAEHMMCIHKQELTPLDVYHRILRFTNYMVAMVNKSLLPLKYNVPFLGDYAFLSTGLKFNLDLILFKSPWAPFNQWHLREDFKRVNRRKELAESLKTHILILGCVNLVLMPVILLWQILYSFYNYAQIIKSEPGSLGIRKWSLYGRYYLRHFNELEHELRVRLSRAYKPATYYMDIFVSPLATVIARNVAFISGSVLAVLILLTVWDEDVLNVEHMLTVMTVCGALVAGAKVFIPNENLVYCPERTLTQVIAHIHYFPIQWKGKAHSYKVMSELDVLFRYTAMYLVDELLSPIITPLILIFKLSHKSQEIVDFFRNFTVDVVGVGDVCSFAQMDVRRHGNPAWQMEDDKSPETVTRTNGYTQAEDGKTEMSLVHFTLTNPGWKPSGDNEKYLAGLKTAAERDVTQLATMPEDVENPMMGSLTGLEDMGGSYRDHAHNILQNVPSPPPRPPGPVPSPPPNNVTTSFTSPVLRGGLSRCTGPMVTSRSMLGPLPSMSTASSRLMTPSYNNMNINTNLEFSHADMAMSALYLHNINHRTRTLQNHRPTIDQISSYRFQTHESDDRDLLLPGLSSTSSS